MTIADYFPLQYTLDRAESVRRFLDGRDSERLAPSLDDVVRAAVELGQQLPDAWKRTFRSLDHAEDGWMTVQQYEDQRNAVLQLFAAVRKTMDDARRAAEAEQTRTGRALTELPRLLALIEDARRQEEDLFRDWQSFRDPIPPPDFSKALTPEQSLANALGVSLQEAKERMDARRRELDSQGRG
jgi:hypothetical protein